MALYALDDIDDAISATRAFLTPLNLNRWAKLALVVFFIGGAGGMNPLQFSGGTPTGTGSEMPNVPNASDEILAIGGPELAVIAGIISLIGVLILGFMIVGSIMEFVFVESLRQEEITIRHYWGEYWKPGLRLFGFRLLLGIVSIGIIGSVLVAALGPVLFGDGTPSFGLLFLAIPIFFLIAIVSGLLNGFTTAFVVPIMLLEDRGLLASWRRFWPTMTGQWKQYLAYAIGAFVLQIAGGLAATIVTLFVAVMIAIPLGIIGLIGFELLSILSVAGWVIIGIAVVLFVIALIILSLFISVPIKTFLRYYALLVLGDTNEAFDVVAERRQTIRE
ncbi:MAG: hypothetical protein ABEI86_05940 [Halobacteriaceae archaeon]